MSSLSIMIKPVSSTCNMKCSYCFYTDVSNKREQKCMGTMSLTTLENIVRKAFAYGSNQIDFAFQGGEPTLAGKVFYEKLIELQNKYNSRKIIVRNSIQTNGYCLDDDLLDFFKKENFLVGISFDGTPEIHDKLRISKGNKGTSAKIKANIVKLQQKQIDFNILCVVNRHVSEHAEEVFNYLSQYQYIQFIPCIDPFDGSKFDYSLNAQLFGDFLIKAFDLYYKAYRNNNPISVRNFDNYISICMGQMPESCGMFGRCPEYYLVEANGNVYPCDFYVLDHLYLGNINDISFVKLKKSSISTQFREDSHSLSKECAECEWYSLCRGGCRRDREPFEGKTQSSNRWCHAYQELFNHASSRMRLMAQEIIQNW